MMETAPPPSEGTPLDPGLRALCGIAAYYRIGADPVQLTRELALGARQANEADIIRAAKLIGLKARLVEKVTAERLATLPTPAIVRMTSGALMVFGGRNPSGLCRLVDPISHAAHEAPLEDLARDIGQALLIARRIGGAGVDPRQFGMRWFLPTIWRYRRPLGHVLAASLFVQIFGLTTPLFFQVVVDKVLTHRGYETLFVLVGGLVVIGVFDVVLQYLRTCSLDQFPREEGGDVVTKFTKPLGSRGGWIALERIVDDRLRKGRVEGAARPVNDKNVVVVLTEVILPFLVEESRAPIGRRDADQHRAGNRRQARHQRLIGLDIGIGGRLGAPEGDLVHHHTGDAAAAHVAKIGGQNVEFRPGLEQKAVRRLPRHLTAKQGNVGEIGPRVLLDDGRLSLVDREAENRRPLAGAQNLFVVDEASGETGDGAGDAVLAAATPDHGPQFAHAALGRIALTGHATKQLDLALVHRDAERALENRLPHRPARAAEPRAEQVGIVEGLDDVDHRAAAR